MRALRTKCRPSAAAGRMPPQPQGAAAPSTANGGRIFLGFQWDASSWDTVPPLWDTLLSWLGQRKVHWNLPALPADMSLRRRTAALKPLRSRIDGARRYRHGAGFRGGRASAPQHRRARTGSFMGLEEPLGYWCRGPARHPAVDPDSAGRGSRPARGLEALRRPWFPARSASFPEPATAFRPSPGCLPFVRAVAASYVPGKPGGEALAAHSGLASGQSSCSSISPGWRTRTRFGAAGRAGGAIRRPAARFPAPRRPGCCLPARPVSRAGRAGLGTVSRSQGCGRRSTRTAGMSRKKRKKNEEYAVLLGHWRPTRDGTARRTRGTSDVDSASSSGSSRTCWVRSRLPEAAST